MSHEEPVTGQGATTEPVICTISLLAFAEPMLKKKQFFLFLLTFLL